MTIPTEVSTSIISGAGVLITLVTVLLSRKGAREDVRIKEDDQAFTQMAGLAATRLEEITRLQASVIRLEGEKQAIVDRELARFDAQVGRCRSVSGGLVDALTSLTGQSTPEGLRRAADAVQTYGEHVARDHPA